MVQRLPPKNIVFLKRGCLALEITIKPLMTSMEFRYAEMTSITEP